MAAEILLPKVGDSAFEGIVGKWLKNEGDFVEEYEPLVEIESDKATVEMPSPATGVLTKILVSTGNKVPINTAIGLIGEEGQEPAAPAPAASVAQTAPSTPSSAPAAAPSSLAPVAAPSTGGGVEVLLPKVGDSAFEGIVGKWLKNEGDFVEEYEPLVEIESDKATVEMPSPATGTLSRIFVETGKKVPINTVIGVIGADDAASLSAPTAAPEAPAPSAPTASAPAASKKASPIAAKLAEEHGLDLNAISGSGPGGRVTADDVREHVKQAASAPAQAAPAAGMALNVFDVLCPKVGDSAFEGLVGKWLKQEGEYVEEYEALVEIESAKATVEMPSPASGTVRRILVPTGQTVPVGTAIAQIETDQAVVGDFERSPGAAAAQEPSPGAAPDQRPDAAPPVSSPAPTSPAPVVASPAASGAASAADSVRQAIAEHMVRAWNTIPHGEATAAADVGHLIRYRERQTERLTFTPFFVAALVKALEECPWANVAVDEHGNLQPRQSISIGVAVAMEQGLLVPVLHNAGGKPFSSLAAEVTDLVARTRARRLKPEEMSGGAFSVTNVGVFGALHSQPIIPEGQTGILGVGSIQNRATVRDGLIAVRPVVYLSAIVDRRVLDELAAEAFLASILRHLASVVSA